ncbi:hypothetical protein CEUSTIGMA_g5209.t1 [Chlamydomonas eustigma]|uniref:DUF4378 domain-containing protein n=1 Tax=Chlamydomonas eustigma TaxID=1157962 RepID=A0A250X3Y5_9CHLO|nr:hypothetical protein CEUSTIGMA_g5209.t1 [Chlamydomonas eustigma]|eukprot:GAX77766.1 hypothetical protein CEUSTIGMA_g5209.t1 [Chlamydomonas eustigma]
MFFIRVLKQKEALRHHAALKQQQQAGDAPSSRRLPSKKRKALTSTTGSSRLGSPNRPGYTHRPYGSRVLSPPQAPYPTRNVSPPSRAHREFMTAAAGIRAGVTSDFDGAHRTRVRKQKSTTSAPPAAASMSIGQEREDLKPDVLALKEVALEIVQRLRGVQKAVFGEKVDKETYSEGSATGLRMQEAEMSQEREAEATLLKKPRLSLDELNIPPGLSGRSAGIVDVVVPSAPSTSAVGQHLIAPIHIPTAPVPTHRTPHISFLKSGGDRREIELSSLPSSTAASLNLDHLPRYAASPDIDSDYESMDSQDAGFATLREWNKNRLDVNAITKREEQERMAEVRASYSATELKHHLELQPHKQSGAFVDRSSSLNTSLEASMEGPHPIPSDDTADLLNLNPAVQSCEDILQDFDNIRSPLRLHPTKGQMLSAAVQRYREQEVQENLGNRKQAWAAGAATAVSPSAMPRPPAPSRPHLQLLSSRSVSGELVRPAALQKHQGDKYNVINTLMRKKSPPPGAGHARSRGNNDAAPRLFVDRHRPITDSRTRGKVSTKGATLLLLPQGPASPGRTANLSAVLLVPPPTGSPPPLGDRRAPRMNKARSSNKSQDPTHQPSIAAAVAETQARMQLAHAGSRFSYLEPTGFSYLEPTGDRVASLGAAGELGTSLPPFVISLPLPPSTALVEGGREGPPARHNLSGPDDRCELEGLLGMDVEERGSRGEVHTPQGHEKQISGSNAANPQSRMAPWELEYKLQESFRKYEEVGAMEVEYEQLQQARGLAISQQAAKQMATELDRAWAVQQREEEAGQQLALQERRLEALATSMKQEIRSETQSHLIDVTNVFVQQLKSHRIAHAQVQTLPPGREAAVQVQPARDAGTQAARPATHEAAIQAVGDLPPGAALLTKGGSVLTASDTQYSEDGFCGEDSIEGRNARGMQLYGNSQVSRGGHRQSVSAAFDESIEEAVDEASGSVEEDVVREYERTDDEVGEERVSVGHLGASKTTSYSASFATEDPSVVLSVTNQPRGTQYDTSQVVASSLQKELSEDTGIVSGGDIAAVTSSRIMTESVESSRRDSGYETPVSTAGSVQETATPPLLGAFSEGYEELRRGMNDEIKRLKERLVNMQRVHERQKNKLQQQLVGPESITSAERTKLLASQALLKAQFRSGREEIHRQISAVKADLAKQKFHFLQLQMSSVAGPLTVHTEKKHRGQVSQAVEVTPTRHAPSKQQQRNLESTNSVGQAVLEESMGEGSQHSEPAFEGADQSIVEEDLFSRSVGSGTIGHRRVTSSLKEDVPEMYEGSGFSQHSASRDSQVVEEVYTDDFDQPRGSVLKREGNRKGVSPSTSSILDEEVQSRGRQQHSSRGGRRRPSRSMSASYDTIPDSQAERESEQDADDDHGSDLSRLSSELRVQQKVLLTELARKKKELAERVKRSQVLERKNRVTQLEKELADIQRALQEADEAEGVLLPIRTNRDQTFKGVYSSQQSTAISEDAELEEEHLPAITAEDSIQEEVVNRGIGIRQQAPSGSGAIVDDEQQHSAVFAASDNIEEEDIYSESFGSAAVTSSSVGRRNKPSNNTTDSLGEGGSSAGVSELEAEYSRKIAALKRDLERKRKQALELQFQQEEAKIAAEMKSLDAAISASSTALQRQKQASASLQLKPSSKGLPPLPPSSKVSIPSEQKGSAAVRSQQFNASGSSIASGYSEDIEEEGAQAESGDVEDEASGNFPQRHTSLPSVEYSSVILEEEASGTRSVVRSIQEAGTPLRYSSEVVEEEEEEIPGLGMRINAAGTDSSSTDPTQYSSGVEDEAAISGLDRSSSVTAVSGFSTQQGHSGSTVGGGSGTIVESNARSRSTVEYSSEVFEESVPEEEEEEDNGDPLSLIRSASELIEVGKATVLASEVADVESDTAEGLEDSEVSDPSASIEYEEEEGGSNQGLGSQSAVPEEQEYESVEFEVVGSLRPSAGSVQETASAEEEVAEVEVTEEEVADRDDSKEERDVAISVEYSTPDIASSSKSAGSVMSESGDSGSGALGLILGVEELPGLGGNGEGYSLESEGLGSNGEGYSVQSEAVLSAGRTAPKSFAISVDEEEEASSEDVAENYSEKSVPVQSSLPDEDRKAVSGSGSDTEGTSDVALDVDVSYEEEEFEQEGSVLDEVAEGSIEYSEEGIHTSQSQAASTAEGLLALNPAASATVTTSPRDAIAAVEVLAKAGGIREEMLLDASDLGLENAEIELRDPEEVAGFECEGVEASEVQAVHHDQVDQNSESNVDEGSVDDLEEEGIDVHYSSDSLDASTRVPQPVSELPFSLPLPHTTAASELYTASFDRDEEEQKPHSSLLSHPVPASTEDSRAPAPSTQVLSIVSAEGSSDVYEEDEMEVPVEIEAEEEEDEGGALAMSQNDDEDSGELAALAAAFESGDLEDVGVDGEEDQAEDVLKSSGEELAHINNILPEASSLSKSQDDLQGDPPDLTEAPEESPLREAEKLVSSVIEGDGGFMKEIQGLFKVQESSTTLSTDGSTSPPIAKGDFEKEIEGLLQTPYAEVSAGDDQTLERVLQPLTDAHAHLGKSGLEMTSPDVKHGLAEGSEKELEGEYSIEFDEAAQSLGDELEMTDLQEEEDQGTRNIVAEEEDQGTRNIVAEEEDKGTRNIVDEEEDQGTRNIVAEEEPIVKPNSTPHLQASSAVEAVTEAVLQDLVHESVQAIVGVVGTQKLTSLAAASSKSASPGDETGCWASNTLRRTATSEVKEDADEKLQTPPHSQTGQGAGDLSTTQIKHSSDLPPLRGQQRYVPPAVEGSSSSSGSTGDSYGDEDLGWGEEGSLDDFSIDVSSLVVPQAEQVGIAKESEPKVKTSETYVCMYVKSVLDIFFGDGAEMPEVLMPGQEPLSLEGYLTLERPQGVAASEGATAGHSEAQVIAHKALYDAVNEALLTVYRECNRIQVLPWVRPIGFSQVIKPLPSPEDVRKRVEGQVLDWGRLRVDTDHDVEKILPLDAAEEERTWADTADEEAEIKLEVAEYIWDDLMSEIAQELVTVDRRMQRRRTGLGQSLMSEKSYRRMSGGG